MTTRILPGTRVRGGNRHPIAIRQFILDYIAVVGEAYGADIHRAYKERLKHLAETSPSRLLMTNRGARVFYYRTPHYASFQGKVNQLAREGLIEVSREEESDNPKFAGQEWKPVRRYYRLATMAVDGHKVDGLTGEIFDGHQDGHLNGNHAQNGRSNKSRRQE